jgi:hypothetical protein
VRLLAGSYPRFCAPIGRAAICLVRCRCEILRFARNDTPANARTAVPGLAGVTHLHQRRCGETEPAWRPLGAGRPQRGAPTGPAHSPCSQPYARPAPVLAERDWWALTPPFHPWPPSGVGLFSVAVVVTRGLLSGRPHFCFRGAAFPRLWGWESGSSSPRTEVRGAAAHRQAGTIVACRR